MGWEQNNEFLNDSRQFSVDLWSRFVENLCLEVVKIQFHFVSLASSPRLACVAQVPVTSQKKLLLLFIGKEQTSVSVS